MHITAPTFISAALCRFCHSRKAPLQTGRNDVPLRAVPRTADVIAFAQSPCSISTMASPALPGLFFCFAACVLLVIVTVSAPIWNDVSFLNASVGGREIHFGVFGYTGSERRLGYEIDPAILGLNTDNLNTTTIRNLTYIMVLHPVAAGLAGLAVIFGLCGAAYSRVGTIFMSLAAALATICTLIVFVIDMVLWGIARNRIRDEGASANYGNANWMVAGALAALLLGFCSAALGSCGRFSRRRTEKV
ncbi:Pali protein, partial [Rhizoctonia solani]